MRIINFGLQQLVQQQRIGKMFLNTPGFVKLFFPKQNVQTKYSSVHQIPVMSLQKQICFIPTSSSPFKLYLHIKSLTPNIALLQKFLLLKPHHYDIYLLPQQTLSQSFQQLRTITPKGLTTLGKMIFNGQKQHPLIKYLKNRSEALYDYQMGGAEKLKDQVGLWVQDTQDRIKYLRYKELDHFLQKELAKYVKVQINANTNASVKINKHQANTNAKSK